MLSEHEGMAGNPWGCVDCHESFVSFDYEVCGPDGYDKSRCRECAEDRRNFYYEIDAKRAEGGLTNGE